MAKNESEPVAIGYERSGDVLRFQMTNVDADELRAYIVALWLVLGSDAARLDMLRELSHYHEHPHGRPPELSKAIAAAYEKAQASG